MVYRVLIREQTVNYLHFFWLYTLVFFLPLLYT